MKIVYYYYTENDQKVVKAKTYYAGNPVYATAVCSPEDTYDKDYGTKLAKAKLEKYVAELRFDKSRKKYNKMKKIFADTLEQYNRTKAKAADAAKYFSDSKEALERAKAILNKMNDDLQNHK